METVRRNKAGELVDVSLQSRRCRWMGRRRDTCYTFRDICERKENEANLQQDAMHDVLTGLPNRALFLDRLNLALAAGCAGRTRGAGCLFLDLDQFKEINDVLGHAAGDVVADGRGRTAAQRSLRPQDSAARLGGDEFAVLVEDILNAGDLETVAKRISGRDGAALRYLWSHRAGRRPALARRWPDRIMLRPICWCGTRTLPCIAPSRRAAGGTRSSTSTWKWSSAASRSASANCATGSTSGCSSFCICRSSGSQDGRLEGFECLLRWRRADGSVDSFGDLLAVAEETGLSITLGRETMEAACWQLRSWRTALPHVDISLAVNLTHRQFYNPDMVLQLQRTLSASGADPTQLMFEVPESALNESPDAAVAILQRMVDCNVRVAMDDFGSSLAPLNHLVRLPLDMVKLDPKLTVAATSTGRQQALLESLLRLGRTLGVQVVAQGIETPEQLRALSRMGCELGQGLLFSPPLDSGQALKLAEQGHLATAPGA